MLDGFFVLGGNMLNRRWERKKFLCETRGGVKKKIKKIRKNRFRNVFSSTITGIKPRRLKKKTGPVFKLVAFGTNR